MVMLVVVGTRIVVYVEVAVDNQEVQLVVAGSIAVVRARVLAIGEQVVVEDCEQVETVVDSTAAVTEDKMLFGGGAVAVVVDIV
mmetsp:Transcript_7876/g.10979  ORF Transcript_7876/g.10979 Transcript_7876/m.10979 type:complete len:84 (-) Transcript_7876:1545-1796(-)